MKNILTLIIILCQIIHSQMFQWESIEFPSNETVKHLVANSDGDLFVATDSLRILKLLNGLGNWINVSNQLPFDTIAGVSIGVNKNIYIAYRNNNIYTSSDKGLQWNVINFEYPNVKIQAFAVNENNWLYVGTNKGVYYLEAGKSTWIHDSTDERDISVIACERGGRVFANYDFSIDNGKTWNFRGMLAQPICIGVKGIHWYNGVIHGIYSSHWEDYGAWGHTNEPVYGIPVYSILPLYDGGYAIAGTSNGLFYTKDWARTWENIGSQLPEKLFTSIAIDSNGFVYVGTINKIYKNKKSVTAAESNVASTIPTKYHLNQNYPNPFNSTTNIEFELPDNGFVTLTIYDNLGREVETIVNEYLNRGSYLYKWNASEKSSGLYFCKLRTTKYSQSIKLVHSK